MFRTFLTGLLLFSVSTSALADFTEEEASRLARLPLESLQREYPNKISHVLAGPHDVASPKALHPAFYGSFDWHSSVHGHWTLVRLLKLFPNLPEASRIRDVLDQNLSEENLAQEADYLSHPLRKSFERPYGWGWQLKLAEELHTWDDPQGQRWAQNMKPLTKAVVARYLDFFPRQTYPIRSGAHNNTALGLTFALDYAQATGHSELESLVLERAEFYYGQDKNVPATWEPGGDHFLSPALTEADLMRRVLPSSAYPEWLEGFLPELESGQPSSLMAPAEVSDRSDPKIVHLDGLNLSRAWAMKGVAQALPSNDPRRKILLDAAAQHQKSALVHVTSGNYEGEHWLASFAVYLLSVKS